MKIRQIALLLLLGLTGTNGFMQETHFRAVTREQLLENTYPADPSDKGSWKWQPSVIIRPEYKPGGHSSCLLSVAERIL